MCTNLMVNGWQLRWNVNKALELCCFSGRVTEQRKDEDYDDDVEEGLLNEVKTRYLLKMHVARGCSVVL